MQLSFPKPNTIFNLLLGGLAGLGIWEIAANGLTGWLLGGEGALEPPYLIRTLSEKWLHYAMSVPTSKIIHYVTGALFYPIGYWLMTRWIQRTGWAVDGFIWGVLTFIFALGICAPLAGFPIFLHTESWWLWFMSLVGHCIYAMLAAYLFERLEAEKM